MAFGKGGYRGGGQHGGGRGRGGGRGEGHHSGNSTIELVVKGWTSSTIPARDQKSAVLGFLKSKSGCQIISDRVVKVHILFIEIWERDKNRFYQLDGSTWSGTTIKIEESRQRTDNANKFPPSGPRADGNSHYKQHNNSGFGSQINGKNDDLFAVEVADKIAAVIRSCYTETDKHLNFTNLANHSGIQQIPDIQNATDGAKVWEAIFTICKTNVWPSNHQRNISVHLISLRQNEITNVTVIEALSRFFPRIQGLDLGDNKLENMNSLIAFSDKFRELQHIIIDGNPVCYLPDTVPTLRQWYPKLKQVNNTPVETIQDAIPFPVGQPAPVLGIGIGVGVGQTPFRPDDRYKDTPAAQIPVDPTRPWHPEIPVDSLFAVKTPDKPQDVWEREVLGLRFSIQTKLNMASTEECLKANHWDYDKALANFSEINSKNQIPRDRFLPV
ncbi:hypothetical protein G647_03103 [Cladophialophora carrionii CBS 160.54]|uniref:TAP-C domain-containing protein n=1 Tax=Cladophialophora carrionii CBS 160.54 TaxID=1279043 RepID=V9DI16_9EURO|nr:uncharacterized protein G647_03103 [Cladophialophora carrionii CBS 160.54]ETI26326.1 hypothetical protein G647_03103 [Cladophialophora carrionii CBS 160.54]